jgi:hypothetical protein
VVFALLGTALTRARPTEKALEPAAIFASAAINLKDALED